MKMSFNCRGYFFILNNPVFKLIQIYLQNLKLGQGTEASKWPSQVSKEVIRRRGRREG